MVTNIAQNRLSVTGLRIVPIDTFRRYRIVIRSEGGSTSIPMENVPELKRNDQKSSIRFSAFSVRGPESADLLVVGILGFPTTKRYGFI